MTEEGYRSHALLMCVMWVGSAVAFAYWQNSTPAGWWWLCGSAVLGEFFDHRNKGERIDE